MNLEVPLEMTVFDGGAGCYEISNKSNVILNITNIEAGKAEIKGNVRVVFRTACDRCLAEVPTFLELEFERVVTSPEFASEDEVVDDLSFMEGYQLNVETFVYNEIIGSWPAKILCKEDCKGLCPVCGQNRNERECGCDTFVPDPRMAAIQDIFNANKEV
ncbi:MAG: YceD family protein [Acetatifactor sp.]